MVIKMQIKHVQNIERISQKETEDLSLMEKKGGGDVCVWQKHFLAF